MSDANPDNTFMFIIVRLLAAAAAVMACFLLYRFAQGYWAHYKQRRGGGGRARRASDGRLLHFGSRKDVLYSRLSTHGGFVEEDEGYHDSDSLPPPSPATPNNWRERPLPDKPLPPLPGADAS